MWTALRVAKPWLLGYPDMDTDNKPVEKKHSERTPNMKSIMRSAALFKTRF